MNQPYDIARYRFVTGDFNWLTMSLRLSAMAAPTMFVPTDQYLDDILLRNPDQLLGTSLPITYSTVTADGTAQTNQVLIPEVPIGPDVTHFIMHEHNNRLILFIDESLNLPFEPNGLDMIIQPDWLEQRGWFRA